LQIVRLVRQHFPGVKILARARNRTHLMELRELGVESPIRESFAGSVELARHVLLDLDEDAERVDRTLDTVVRHDQEVLDRAQAVFRDEAKLIARAKSSRAELDGILREDAALDGRSDRQAPEQQAALRATGGNQ
jgi:voltage-gated potassium channel Kch